MEQRYYGSSRADASALSAFQGSAESFRPLSPPEQLEFARRIRERSAEFERLSSEGSSPSRRDLDAQDRDVEHLCASCWRLTWLIVREQAEARYGRERARAVLPDLLAEGNVALVQAVRTFDPTRTPRFATYAARVVRDHVRAVLSREGHMRLAPSWGRVKRIAATRIPELTTALGRNPTLEEIQEDLLERCLEWAYGKLTPEQAALPAGPRRRAALAKLRKQGMLGAIRDIEDVLAASRSILSLDQPVGEDGGMTMGETVSGSDDTASDALSSIASEELREAVASALAVLSDRERRIVLMRYGFDGSEGMTYGRIAEEFGVSSERIRQIEKGALEKLMQDEDSASRLASFLQG